jgi:hypothetical protein
MSIDREIVYRREEAAQFRALARDGAAADQRELAIHNSRWAIADRARLLEETSRLIDRRRGG